jgi:hypothetical protein
MAREVNQTQAFADKLVKLIPTEIVGAYMVIAGILGVTIGTDPASLKTEDKVLIQVGFFALLVLTPIYLWKSSGVRNKVQLIVTSSSFVVWVYTLGGPFTLWQLPGIGRMYHQKTAAIILVLWSLASPWFVRPHPQENALAARG